MPIEAIARGGRGSETSTGILIGLGAIFLMGWLVAQVKSDTWRMLGGMFLLVAALAFVIQIAT